MVNIICRAKLSIPTPPVRVTLCSFREVDFPAYTWGAAPPKAFLVLFRVAKGLELGGFTYGRLLSPSTLPLRTEAVAGMS